MVMLLTYGSLSNDRREIGPGHLHYTKYHVQRESSLPKQLCNRHYQIINLRCRKDHARMLSIPRYPLMTITAVVSLEYIVCIETLISPVNKLAWKDMGKVRI
jgi:hypothetical protein